MEKITDKQIEHLAELSSLALSKEEMAKMTADEINALVESAK